MNNPYNLKETNWRIVKDEVYEVAILPWGATEAHNYHLPYGTDSLLAEDIAKKSAAIAWDKGAKSLLLPCINYGVNTGQIDVPFCMNMSPSTQLIFLEDIVKVLLHHRVKKMIIINAHGGNNFQPIIRELAIKYPEMLVFTLNWWKACDEKEYFVEPGDHAGELETSVMMSAFPDLVLSLDQAGDGEERGFKVEALKRKWAWTQRRWVYLSKDTGVGNPSLATANKGERFLKDCVDRVADFIKEISSIRQEEDLYD